MKKRIIYNLLLGVSIFMGACEKQVLDLTAPDRLSSDLAFSTPTKIESSLIGAYDKLQANQFLSGRALVYIDIQGDDIYDKGNFFGTLALFNQLSSAGAPSGVWTQAYAAIATANTVAAGIDANSSKLSAQKVKEFKAECLFVRAIANFYLVNFFAQPYAFTADASHPGIPLITQAFSTNDPAANQPRSTVAQVYTAIIGDLTAALADLPAKQVDVYSTKTRATKATAAALLSRVYLYKGDYANAKTMANNIINGQYGIFSLNSTPKGCFGPGNYQTPETIFSIPNNSNDNPNTNNALPQHYYPYGLGGRGDLAVSPSFISTTTNPYFASDDMRRTTMLIHGTSVDGNAWFTNKYPDVASRADWAPIIRYAEILLTYAEATARLAGGVDADAISKLNMVRDRSRVSAPQYTVASFADKNALIDAIMGERRIELAFEGHRYWDLLRTKSAITNKYDSDGVSIIPTEAYGAPKNIFPIPQSEVDKSKGVLVQNPGY